MGEWFKKSFEKIKNFWAKGSLVQKIIALVIVAVIIAGVIALFSVSASPSMAPVIDAPIRDQDAQDRIITRINAEGVKTSITPSGIITVPDENTARRMRAILIREDLIPQGTNPWAIFNRNPWTMREFDLNVNLQRAITQTVQEHIKALEDIDDAKVTLVMPKKELFEDQQDPVSASVTIFPKPGSDITENPKKIEGIQKLLKFAVQGLKDENITITDNRGVQLNDFAGRAEMERIKLIEEGNKLIRKEEDNLKKRILSSLQGTFGADRVRDLNLKLEMDLSKQTVNSKEYTPITMKPRTPGLSYDDSQMAPSLIRSQTTSDTSWKGTGINPEGPSGVEGQTAPAFRDMQNLYGQVDQKTRVENNEINEKVVQQEKMPSIDRVTVSVNIDGVWTIKMDEKEGKPVITNGKIEREYTPISPEDIRQTTAWIQNAVGYKAARGDSVSVQNIPFDRTKQFADEDAAMQKQKQMRIALLLAGGGIILLLIGFLISRIVARAIERRRRAEEEERARKEQALRDAAIMQAEEAETQITMSVEERQRLEMQETIANMAKEHPEDVASLIRTWLLEE